MVIIIDIVHHGRQWSPLNTGKTVESVDEMSYVHHYDDMRVG